MCAFPVVIRNLDLPLSAALRIQESILISRTGEIEFTDQKVAFNIIVRTFCIERENLHVKCTLDLQQKQCFLLRLHATVTHTIV